MAEPQPSVTKTTTTTEGSNRNPNRRRHNNQNNAGGGNGQNQGNGGAGGGGSQRGGEGNPRQNNTGGAGSHNHGNGAAGGGQRGGGGQNQNTGGGGGQRGGEGANPRQNNGGGGRRRGGNGEHGGAGGRRGGGYQGGSGRRPGRQEPQVIKHRKDHAGIAFEGTVTDCHICCQPSDVFGVGQCLHPVCIECCIRMRILSDNKSCPQCRSPIETLYIVSAPTDWDTFSIPSNPLTNPDTNKYCLMFENAYTMRVYDSYLAHSCQICAKKGDSIEFPTFGALRHHTAQVHDRQFCTICCDHLNVLSKDRVTYSKDEYERHLRGADREASGHKGHPKCLFCELRFYDEEHQYRHMRQQYYFCQICEIDGGGNFFYPKVEQLRGHYRNKHHPCLEGECRDLGIVFRSDVELGVHRAAEHGSAKRNVNINFQFSNGHMGNRVPRNGGGREPRATGANSEPVAAAPAPPPPPPQPTVIIPSAQSPFVNLVPSRFNTRTNASDFPTLPTAPPARPAIPTNWRQEVQAMRRPATQAGASRPAAPLSSAEHFPSLGGGPRRPATASTTPDQFPSLGGGSSSSSAKKPGNAANPWAKGQPAASLFAQPKVRLVKNNPEPSRKKVIPTPDIWPEGMRERVEAKMKGLPDPGPKEEVPLDPLFRVEAAKKAKRAAAKKKKGLATASALTADDEPNLVTKTKFNHLRDQDSSDDESNKAGPSSSARPQLSRTADNFVRIDAAPTLRSVAASIGAKSTPANTPKLEEPAKPKTSPKPKPDAPLPSDPTPAEAARLPAPSVNDLPSHPSLVELARMATSYWPFGRSGADGSETNSSVQKKPATGWSTGPPPGFN